MIPALRIAMIRHGLQANMHLIAPHSLVKVLEVLLLCPVVPLYLLHNVYIAPPSKPGPPVEQVGNIVERIARAGIAPIQHGGYTTLLYQNIAVEQIVMDKVSFIR